jgi:hypothetical protein
MATEPSTSLSGVPLIAKCEFTAIRERLIKISACVIESQTLAG